MSEERIDLIPKMTAVTEASFRCQIKSGRLCVLNSGFVYDLTEFANRHPGGRELIENNTGQDVTQLMNSSDFHKHSPAAYSILDKYIVGELIPSNGKVHSSNSHLNGHTNGHANGHLNGHINGQTNGHSEVTRRSTNGVSNGHVSMSAEQHVNKGEAMIDWEKPILWQVGNMGEHYFEWVHSPIDTPLRLFQNDLFETCSKSYWWLVLLYWVPVAIGTLIYAFLQLHKNPVTWSIFGLGDVEVTTTFVPALFFLGFLMWTFDEYVVHRWLFHCRPPSNSRFLITLHFLFHGQHHKSPMDKCRLVFPPVPATLLGFIIYNMYRILGPPQVAQLFFAGTIVGYLCYDLVHYYLHHGNPSLNYFKNLKTYHVKHHFKEQDRGFGISSKLWDYPFGTLIKS